MLNKIASKKHFKLTGRKSFELGAPFIIKTSLNRVLRQKKTIILLFFFNILLKYNTSFTY